MTVTAGEPGEVAGSRSPVDAAEALPVRDGKGFGEVIGALAPNGAGCQPQPPAAQEDSQELQSPS
ncbi:hypothetical protein GCM10017673_34380 [Streptosporangium violaceochromogenes]|nr:hypothetical protein GCM10017673_34380 [Streptosporangium violaceochromogenes]